MLDILPLTVGQMATQCYLVFDRCRRHCLIVDPGDDAEYITDTIIKQQLIPDAIVATHGHFDHVLAARAVQLAYNIPCLMHASDMFLLDRMTSSAKHFLHLQHVDPAPVIDTYADDGAYIGIGDSRLRVLHTPGHTPGSITLCDEVGGVLLVGDLLFSDGAVGRTDHTYSHREDLMASILRVLALPINFRILPGHGEETTVKREKVFHAI